MAPALNWIASVEAMMAARAPAESVGRDAPAAGAVAGPWEDHQTREIVNQLRDCAKEFHATQQLRERLLDVLGPMIDWVRAAQAPTSPAPPGREGMGMKPQVKIGWVVCNRDGKLMFCPVNELA
jgi:hypothetical protein